MSNDLKQQSVNGVMWSAIERFSTQVVYFVMGVFIARLLSPSDYGTVALLNIFFALSNTFIDSGFSSALIRKIERTQSDNSTIFYFNVVVGVVLYVTLSLCAPLIARFFEEPLLVPLTRVIGLSVIFNSLSVVPYAILITRIDFKVQAQVSLCAALISGVVVGLLWIWGVGSSGTDGIK